MMAKTEEPLGPREKKPRSKINDKNDGEIFPEAS
jgi:hypothetical protein